MCCWNVAGIAEEQLDTFLQQVSDNQPWDVLLLQEAFRRTDGIASEWEHLIFTTEAIWGGLRCPAIIFNHCWAQLVKPLGSGKRWVAVRFGMDAIFLSLHLPHTGLSLAEYRSTLYDVAGFLHPLSYRHLTIGVDANVGVAGIVDYAHVGEAVLHREYCVDTSERSQLLHEFLVDHGLVLVNTFVEASDPSNLITRSSWGGGGGAQIDFLAVSSNLSCINAGVDYSLSFTTDHRLVWGIVRLDAKCTTSDKPSCIRHWTAGDSWSSFADSFDWNFYAWDRTVEAWRAGAFQHCARRATNRPKDIVLQDLLEQRAIASSDERRILNRLIWRHRRKIKRKKALLRLQDAAFRGCAPAPSRTKHVNWFKLFGGEDAQTCIHTFYTEIYDLEVWDKLLEIHEKEMMVTKWLDLRIDVTVFQVTRERLLAALLKLRLGKKSPDGITAEILRSLPSHAIDLLAAFFTKILASLEIPESWTVAFAVLLPKVVGASNLSKFRAIACLSTVRKLLGYIWMSMLPPLRFESFQTGFVKGSQAADGIFSLLRVIELSREWAHPVFMVQLDLKKAFDRVLHSAIIQSLQLQGASLQCIAVVCRILLQSSLAISLSNVTTEGIQLQRGVPQGAPESPLLFILVTEMVLRGLRAKWQSRGDGWSLDGTWLDAVCYADDVILLASSKARLERMVADTMVAFSQVGLEVGAEKTHWSSIPRMPSAALRVGTERVAWTSHLTFVGGVVSFDNNSAEAIQYRMTQAEKVYHKWKPILLCKHIALSRRIWLAGLSVIPCFLWLSETWHPTKKQRQHMDSWGARLMSRVARTTWGPGEDINSFWRRFFRRGHLLMQYLGGSLSDMQAKRLHVFAERLAEQSHGPLYSLLRTRNLEWWRAQQDNPLGMRHPRRFFPWRWEEQLTIGWLHS